MKAMTAVTLLMLAFVALAGVSVFVAYRLVVTGHPVFAVIAGCFGLWSLLLGSSIEMKQKGEK